eukprot:TRINITY_DN20297_c0_g1_i1.p1 TRINITY_DN20297_c0_g1~~TRINITY_DN20297_c0_g1_i1.p1  ORF type:complete len:266 (-),score=43.81 TRINITY_DN20297_c0_g1_i1:116-913(-)
MGIGDQALVATLAASREAFEGGLQGLLMCELGNQWLLPGTLPYLLHSGFTFDSDDVVSIATAATYNPDLPIQGLMTAKKYFSLHGFIHKSIDRNGQDGALALDLSKSIWSLAQTESKVTREDDAYREASALRERCDVSTDFGTLEHVADDSSEGLVRGLSGSQRELAAREAQYYAFKNMHELAKPSIGLMIHTLPLKHCWPGHGAFEYDPSFFTALNSANDYKGQVTAFWPACEWSPNTSYALHRSLSSRVPKLSYWGRQVINFS